MEIDEIEIPNAKKVAAGLRKKGQSKVHFVKERDSRRRQILDAYSKLNINSTIFVSRQRLENLAREECLEALIFSLSNQQQCEVILDRDESSVFRDKNVFLRTLPKISRSHSIHYRHEEPSQENLLWIPDAIAWAFARGGLWRRELAKFDTEVKHLD